MQEEIMFNRNAVTNSLYMPGGCRAGGDESMCTSETTAARN